MYERTRKESHLDTIWYEIDMLDYCFARLTHEPPASDAPFLNLLIEGYLLHYRNLIQFFAGNENRHQRHGNDLSTCAPSEWANRTVEKSEIGCLRIPGKELDDEFSDRISVCLQHCTKERAETLVDWDIRDMHARISPAIDAFRKAFPKQPGFMKVGSVMLEAAASSTAQMLSFSTATVSRSVALFPDSDTED